MPLWRRAFRSRRYRGRTRRLSPHPDDLEKVRKKAKAWNKKRKIVGWTPDYWVSPIDAVPYAGLYNKGRKAYKLLKRGVRLTKAQYQAYKYYIRHRKSRRKASSSSSRKRRNYARRRGTRRPWYYNRRR